MSVGDRPQLADFLRTRREALQPEDVGLPRGPRRRTGGLRREEGASLAGMSADYYGRIEQRRGPAPGRWLRDDPISPGMMRIIDRLMDTPAMVLSRFGETLRQTPMAVALFGDETRYTGLAPATVYRWLRHPAN